MTERFYDEKKLRKLWGEPISLKQIGERLGGDQPFSAGTVSQMARRLNLGPRPKKANQATHWRRADNPELHAQAEAKRLQRFAERREQGIRNRPRDIKLRRKKQPESALVT